MVYVSGEIPGIFTTDLSYCTMCDMCKYLTPILIVALLTFTGCVISTESAPRLLVVAGEGKVKVAPDTAVIKVNVHTLMKEGSEVSQQKNNTLSQSVIDGLVANGVSRENITTTSYSLD